MANPNLEALRLIKIFSEHSRAIPIDGTAVSVLKTPTEYFTSLLSGIESAKRRLLIASLYCGTGPGKEEQFLEALGRKVQSTGEELKVQILLDALRGTRPTKGPSGEESSSAIALSKMLSNNVGVSLFHTPALRGLLKRVLPPRVNEVVGVSHIKAYLFDDNVLMSGANLSSEYFTVRQDRYWIFSDCPELAAWLQLMMQHVSHHSYSLQSDLTLAPTPCGYDPLRQPGVFRHSLRHDLGALSQPTPSSRELPAAQNVATPTELEKPAEAAGCSSGSGEGGVVDTWVFPTMQLASAGVRQDEHVTAALIRAGEAGGRFTLSSPYLNLARPFKEALAANSKVDVSILTASPEANGFFGAKGAAGFIPTAYGMLQRSNWRFLSRWWGRGMSVDPPARRQLLEYKRDGWQYHAKGIWYTPPGNKLPIAATIGSPNFGYRSAHRDLECQLFVVTLNPALRQALADEVSSLVQHCSDITQQQLQPLQPRASFRLRLLARLLRSFL